MRRAAFRHVLIAKRQVPKDYAVAVAVGALRKLAGLSR
jgi:hypothetical protein